MNKKKRTQPELPMSFEERLRRDCPAVFDIQENTQLREAPMLRTGGRVPSGFQPHDPSQGMGSEPGDAAGDAYLQPPQAQYAGGQKGGYDHPNADPATARLGSMAQRLANRPPDPQAVKQQIMKNLDHLDPSQLIQVQKMILHAFGTKPPAGVPGNDGGSGAYGGPRF